MSLKVWLIHIIGGARPARGKGEGRMGNGRETRAHRMNERLPPTRPRSHAPGPDAGPPSPSQRHYLWRCEGERGPAS